MTDVRIGLEAPEFTITRMFNAPRELVYRIWTDPAYVAQWWGVSGATNPVCEMDVRAGGSMRIVMQTADGDRYDNRGVYLEVIENERIVYQDVREDAPPQWSPPVGVHTVTFESRGSQTLVTLTSRFASFEARDAMVGFGVTHGIQQSLDRLEALLANMQTKEI